MKQIQDQLKNVDLLEPVEVSNDGFIWLKVQKINFISKKFELIMESYMHFDKVNHIRNIKSNVQKVKDHGYYFAMYNVFRGVSIIPETEENASMILKMIGKE